MRPRLPGERAIRRSALLVRPQAGFIAQLLCRLLLRLVIFQYIPARGCFLLLVALGVSWGIPATGRGEVELPLGDPRESISVKAQTGHRWRQGIYDVWLLEGSCRVQQGEISAQCEEAVLWIDSSRVADGFPTKVICYLEGGVMIDFSRHASPHAWTGSSTRTLKDHTWLGRFFTLGEVEFQVALTDGEPAVKPAVFHRGVETRGTKGGIEERLAQQPSLPPPPTRSGAEFSGRRVRILPRSGIDLQVETLNNAERNESVLVATMGATVLVEGALVEGVSGTGSLELGQVEIQADNVVAWTSNVSGINLFGEAPGQPQADLSNLPLEFYLEGNIVFRQGRRVIYADRMYYNVNGEKGIVLNAEVLTPVTDFDGLLRVKADVLHQLDRHNFEAYGGAITSSLMGQPRYWLQSEQITLRDVQQTRIDPLTGMAAVDPVSGESDVDHQLLASSRNNFLYIGSTPVLYWPFMVTDLSKPTYYVDRVRVKNDNIFGFQIFTDLDAYQLLGIREPPRGTEWTISLDYLSERGPAVGSNFTYDRPDAFGFQTPVKGMLDSWAIKDEGFDNLGLGRRSLAPEEDYRGRLLWRHRQRLPRDIQLTAEAGWISDRNFLEQYFEQEWDREKDQNTGLELKQYLGHSTWSLTSDVRVNSFFTQTEWLPRLDHFVLGYSLGDIFTWHAHSHVGYGRLRTADAPLDPIDAAKFDPLAWEADREGVRAATRQEINIPVDLGPFKVVPYLLGEAAYWGEDLDGDEVTRLYGQAGLRASLPFSRVNPEVQNQLFNLNGLAHKVTLETDLFVADANRNLDQFPLYDPLDDDSIEFFRRRFYFDTFGGVPGGNVPLKFDERYFALRSGLQGWVSSPSTEVADDMLQAKVAVRQRWQTKRGLPGRERIVDWIVLDIEGMIFPNADRDNFGEEVGMLDYDFRWHVGDRFTLLSDGYADVFSDGLRTYSVGGVVSRPSQGRLYLGYRQIEGPISSHILTGSLSYRMSEKWIASGGASIDLESTGNVTESFGLTRIGESALIRFGVTHDVSRNNVGLQLTIEPRFLSNNRMGRVGGIQVEPAGALGLE